MPELPEAITILNQWIEDRLFSLRSNMPKPFFLSALIQMCSLALFFDGNHARNYLIRLPCILDQPMECYISEDKANIIYDIVAFLDGGGPNPLSSGINSLKYGIRSISFS